MDKPCISEIEKMKDTKGLRLIYAKMDPAMGKDPRIIANLLALERSTMPHCDYFRHIQRDIQPFMRKVVTTWMLEVSNKNAK